MDKRQIQFKPKYILFYLLGFLTIGFGVNMMLRSELGAGAWDATNYALNELMQLRFPNITLGTTSLIISVTIWAVVLLYKRQSKLLAMVIPIIFVSLSIDFWDLVIFKEYSLEGSALLIRSLFFIIGGLAIPLGLSLIVASNFPAFVYDELTIMMGDIFKAKNFGMVRLGIEITGIVLAIIFGLLAGTELEVDGILIGFGQVNVGSIIMMFVIGPIMNGYLRLLGYTKKEEIANE